MDSDIAGCALHLVSGMPGGIRHCIANYVGHVCMYNKGTNPPLKKSLNIPEIYPKGSTDYVCNFLPQNIG